MIDPLDDTSRWTVLANRMETPQIIKDAMDEMMADFINSLPEDSPALALWHRLPKPPRPGAESPSTPYTVDSVLTLRSKTGIGQQIGPCNPERESPEVVGGQPRSPQPGRNTMTRTAATKFQDDLAEIEALAVIEAQGVTPKPEHWGAAFSSWLFNEDEEDVQEAPAGTLTIDLAILHTYSRSTALVLAAIQQHPGMTRAEIEKLLGLGQSIVHRIVKKLVADNLVREDRLTRSTRIRFYSV